MPCQPLRIRTRRLPRIVSTHRNSRSHTADNFSNVGFHQNDTAPKLLAPSPRESSSPAASSKLLGEGSGHRRGISNPMQHSSIKPTMKVDIVRDRELNFGAESSMSLDSELEGERLVTSTLSDDYKKTRSDDDDRMGSWQFVSGTLRALRAGRKESFLKAGSNFTIFKLSTTFDAFVRIRRSLHEGSCSGVPGHFSCSCVALSFLERIGTSSCNGWRRAHVGFWGIVSKLRRQQPKFCQQVTNKYLLQTLIPDKAAMTACQVLLVDFVHSEIIEQVLVYSFTPCPTKSSPPVPFKGRRA